MKSAVFTNGCAAACGLAVLLREIAKKVAVYGFSDNRVEVQARRGFALRDAMDASQRHNSTHLGNAVEKINRSEKCDRLIVITDEQAHDKVPAPSGSGYLINVASYKNGVGYGKWVHISAHFKPANSPGRSPVTMPRKIKTRSRR